MSETEKPKQTEKPKHYVLQIHDVTIRAQATIAPPPVNVEQPQPENKA